MAVDGVDAACVFCEMVAGRIEASRVFEDERILAFLDPHPMTTGHVVVVPKRHCAGLAQLDESVGAQMFRVAHRIAQALRLSGIPCEGINLFLADGEVAFQEVLHIHLNVFPRTDGDGFIVGANWVHRTREELDLTATRVRKGLAKLSGRR
jgi:diadenosine tetraphosphate (Ap4A) HIT family hydrolase